MCVYIYIYIWLLVISFVSVCLPGSAIHPLCHLCLWKDEVPIELLCILLCILRASQVALVVKNLPAKAGDIRAVGSLLDWKTPWKRAWQPTPVFLPGESHRQRSQVGYGP